MVETIPPIHPGEILRDEFMEPFGLSQNALVKAALSAKINEEVELYQAS